MYKLHNIYYICIIIIHCQTLFLSNSYFLNYQHNFLGYVNITKIVERMIYNIQKIKKDGLFLI